jgi:uncharacterized protein (DUF58 family)
MRTAVETGTNQAAGSLQSFRGLDLTVRRRLDGLLHGEYGGVRLGPGSDAEELARYQPGHDVRRIDWKVTARTRQPHLWLTQAQHELDTWLLLDQTPSMAFGTVAAEKADLGTTVAAAMGLLTDGPDNRLGVGVLSTDGVAWSAPLGGRIAAHRALRTAPGPRNGTVSQTLAEALSALAARHRRPGLRVIISDLIGPAGAIERPFDWEAPLRRLTARHDVVVVEVVDPRELELPPVGQLVLVDPESGRQREVNSSDRRLRTAYASAAAVHRSATAAAVRAARAGHVLLRTDNDWITELARFVRARRRLPARRAQRRTR